MPASDAVLTPFTRDAAQRTGSGLWRKKLLPVGEVRYQGRILKFTKEYLGRIADAFRGKAYDQVPFQLAPDDNRHTNDVERFAGEIADMTAEDDGLWITLSPTERGQKVLTENPKVGVSARIVEEYDRSDGKFFPAAIQHVLATLDPRIPGLGGWQAVEASNTDVQVTFDLSNLHFTGDEGITTMPDLNGEQQARLAQLLDLPADQWQQFVSGLAPLSDADLQQLTGDQGQGAADPEVQAIADWIDGMSDQELLGLEASLEGQAAAAGAQPVPAGAGAGAGLSWEAMQAIELANAQSSDALVQLSAINAQLDEERFQGERRRYFDMGVPAPVIDKFAPLLHGTGHAVELSNGQVVDAGQVVREGLAEYANMARLLDLTGEEGSVLDEPDPGGQASQAREDLIGRAKSQMGLIR